MELVLQAVDGNGLQIFLIIVQVQDTRSVRELCLSVARNRLLTIVDGRGRIHFERRCGPGRGLRSKETPPQIREVNHLHTTS